MYGKSMGGHVNGSNQISLLTGKFYKFKMIIHVLVYRFLQVKIKLAITISGSVTPGSSPRKTADLMSL